MPIDWFTVAAQAVNFVILVALLTRFLYQPLRRVVGEREAKVAALLDDAARRAAEADARAQRLDAAERELGNRRRQALDDLAEEVGREREALLEAARAEVGRREREWHGSLERRQAEILDRVARTAVSHLAEALRAALADIADTELEERAVAAFLARFDALGGDELEAIGAAVRRSGATVRSARELAAPLRATLRERLEGRWGHDLTLHFEVEPRLLCGLALEADGRRLTWNAEQYVLDLEEELRRHLDEGDDVEAARRPAATAGAEAPTAEAIHAE